jgi:transposase
MPGLISYNECDKTAQTNSQGYSFMNQTRRVLSNIWHRIQAPLLPWLEDEMGALSRKQQQLVETLEVAQIESHIQYRGCRAGRPQECRSSIARAYIAKAVYNMPTTEMLIDRLKTDIQLRRICGWERINEIPSQSTFSRAFSEFSESELPSHIHSAIIEKNLGQQIIGHISRDSTSIHARERPEKVIEKFDPKVIKKRGRPKKGEIRDKKPKTRIEKQLSGLKIKEMVDDLPVCCNVGTKRNSKGYKTSWVGYKLHIDCADGGIPVSCLLSSASLHDSQVAIPLATITHQKVTSCYDLMDAAYDVPQIKQHSESLGHVPIIDENPRRSKERKKEIKLEQKGRKYAGYKLAENIRYNERSTVERVNGRLKDDFNGRMVRVKGAKKVMAHLMFGIIALTTSQLMKIII